MRWRHSAVTDERSGLAPGNMQEFGFIQAVGKTKEEFWKMSDGIAVGQDASNVLAYMKLMFDEARILSDPDRIIKEAKDRAKRGGQFHFEFHKRKTEELQT